MKKVLIISGSARKKGNTMSMVKIVEQQMRAKDSSIEFEYLYLIDKDLKFCIGCNQCLVKGGHNCPLKDDKEEIFNVMNEADAIIFASPGYSHMVSGLMKNFIDRFMYLDHMPELIAKPSMIISTSGGDGYMDAPKYMYNMSFGWWGCDNVAIIGIPHAFFVLNEKFRRKTTKQLQKAADALNEAMNSDKLKKPSFKQYMYFMFNKTELQISDTVMPVRTKFWNDRGWMDMNYYYETKVNPLYKAICSIMFLAMKVGMKIMLGKNANENLANYVANQ